MQTKKAWARRFDAIVREESHEVEDRYSERPHRVVETARVKDCPEKVEALVAEILFEAYQEGMMMAMHIATDCLLETPTAPPHKLLGDIVSAITIAREKVVIL